MNWAAVIKESGLESLLSRFDSGLDSKVQTTGDGISLGQKQLIAFMRFGYFANPNCLSSTRLPPTSIPLPNNYSKIYFRNCLQQQPVLSLHTA